MLRLFKQYYPIHKFVFFVVEGCVIFFSVLLASVLLTYSNSIWFDVMLCLRICLVTIVIQITLYYNDLYDFQVSSSIMETGVRLLQALGIATILLALIYFLFPLAIIHQRVFILSIVFLFVFIILWRFVYIVILGTGVFNEKIIILGSSDLAMDIAAEINNHIDCGYEVHGMIPDPGYKGTETGSGIGELRIIHEYDKLSAFVKRQNIAKIIVAVEDKRLFFPTKDLLNCRVAGIDVMEGNTFYEMLTGKLLVKELNPSWLIFSDGFKSSKVKILIKRFLDIGVSCFLMILLLPLFFLVAVLIKIDSRGPILFSQDRVGQGKNEYMMHKFRSMVNDAEKLSGPVWAVADDGRVTRLGRILRKYRIDELPQLWDVLLGRMSIVGPRPERKHFTDKLERAIPYYTQRFVVKPGITGWAQVCYQYGSSVDDAVEKLNYDLFYIKNMSIMMDLMIVLKTIKTVLFGKGAR